MTQITATIIADSVSSVNGQRITTFELQYPRFIHSELMTHRLFSRNAMSSRAVPIEKMIEQVRKDPAMPIHWGINQPGMQAKEELDGIDLIAAKSSWKMAANEAADVASGLAYIGAHKQIANRILEPFQLMKTVLTATEFDNFFWLRCHEDAQPEIKDLADKMFSAMKESSIVTLEPADWHTPYYQDGYWSGDFGILDKHGNTVEDALAISSSCCAQVSYRLLDHSIEKARKVYQRLVESTPVHASPFEHCATPISESYCNDPSDYTDGLNLTDSCTWQEGVTHIDRNGNFWSGNLKGFIQYRQLIDGNVCNKFEEKTHETS